MLTELFREVIPVLEQVVVIAEAREMAKSAPRDAIRGAVDSAVGKLIQAAEVAGEQMDMLIDRTIRRTVRAKRQATPRPRKGAQGAAVTVGNRAPGGTGKRPVRAVKRAGGKRRRGRAAG